MALIIYLYLFILAFLFLYSYTNFWEIDGSCYSSPLVISVVQPLYMLNFELYIHPFHYILFKRSLISHGILLIFFLTSFAFSLNFDN